ncbi:MAG: GTPase Era [Synergistaceae bacterium]|jgi:GTP-binding protein Era|nr:GTPase Era [Synergistaceae bacterium]
MNAASETPVYRAGYVTLIGSPNAGKSSIINALLGEKVAAVSDKPQTTRNAVRCVLTTGEYQIVVVDTPGVHKPRYAFGEFMAGEIEKALGAVDAVCLVADITKNLDDSVCEISARIARLGVPLILAANKIDKLRDKEDFWKYLETFQARLKPSSVVPVSALEGTNIGELGDELAKYLPEGGAIYDGDVLMDATERFLAAEIIRERVFEAAEHEVPHSTAVSVEEFKSPDEYPDMKRASIRADIIVERQGQKGILIGQGGKMLKKIKTESKREMERRFGWPVTLELWVKVRPKWRKSNEGMRTAGYTR